MKEGVIEAKVNGRVAGFYRLHIAREDGTEEDTGWFPNLITDQGLDWIGGNGPKYNTSFGGNYLNTHCGVGTSNTTPTTSDTHLNAPLAMYPPAAGSNVEGGSITYASGSPPYWSCIWTYSFAIGAVVGNVAEVGVGNTISTDTTPQLFSHALILASGVPTTISVTSGDALTVTYEMRYYIDTTDNSYSMVISGVTYTGTYRRMQITSPPVIYFPVFGSYNNVPTGNTFSTAYQGFSLGPVTGNPTYSASIGNTSFTYSTVAYTSGTYFCTFITNIPLGVANYSPGISGFSTQCNHGQYQFSISPVIPKTSSYTLSINWNVSWARYP